MRHAGVPRVFDRIYNGVVSKIEEKGGIAAKLFHWGFKIKSNKLRRNVPCNKVLLTSFPYSERGVQDSACNISFTIRASIVLSCKTCSCTYFGLMCSRLSSSASQILER